MIPKDLVKKLRRIEIHTARLANEQLAGSYHSVFKGRGMAFSEVRQYQPGDDIRFIDWNVSARMNEAYVKVFTEEREMTVMLLVDLSGSLDFGSQHQQKIDLLAEVSALLAFSAIKNNDRVGLILFTDRIERVVPAKKGKAHVMRVVTEILQTKPRGRGTDIGMALELLSKITRRRAVTFMVSDFMDRGYERPLRISARRHDVIPVIVADPRETEMPNLGVTLLEDLETGTVVEVDTGSPRFRKRYREITSEARGARERAFKRMRLDSVGVVTGQDCVKPLAEMFRLRRRRLGGFR